MRILKFFNRAFIRVYLRLKTRIKKHENGITDSLPPHASPPRFAPASPGRRHEALLDMRRMKSGSQCHMCGRCSGHREAVTLAPCLPGAEIASLKPAEAGAWEARLWSPWLGRRMLFALPGTSRAARQAAFGTIAKTRIITPSPATLFRLMSPAQQQVLFENTARSTGDAPREIQLRHIRNCLKADPAYGKGVADALGVPLSEA